METIIELSDMNIDKSFISYKSINDNTDNIDKDDNTDKDDEKDISRIINEDKALSNNTTIYTKEPKITCIYGRNKYRDNLIYNMIYEYVHSHKYKFCVVIGNVFPYYEYISDNIYMKYDEYVLHNYIKQMNILYESSNGKVDPNILIIDTKELDLTTSFWKYFLTHHKIYNTDIIIIQERVSHLNKNILKRYIDILHVMKNLVNESVYIDELYYLFYDDIYDYEHFVQIYKDSIITPLDVIVSELENNKHYLYQINTQLPRFNFNTYKIYNENKMYRQRCCVSDIIDV